MADNNDNNSHIPFLQINLHKSKTANSELLKRLTEGEGIIALLTEPWFSKKGHIPGFNDFNIYYQKSFTGSCRAAIVIDKSFNSWIVHEYTNNDMVTICVNIQNTNYYIASIYMDGNADIPNKFVNLISYCKENNFNLIIGTDSNAHSPLWGENYSDKRGNDLEELLFTYNLELLNDGITPTFSRKEESVNTFIDLTICNISHKIKDWTVDLTPSFSDHRYIKFKLSEHFDHNRELELNLQNCYWNKFRSLVSNEIDKLNTEILSASSLDNLALTFETIIRDSLKASCPLKKLPERRIVKWWTNEVTKIRREPQVEDLHARKSAD